jgi:hypothetical protein
MAQYDSPNTKPYQVSLTRMWYENRSTEQFRTLIRPEYQDRFRHISWEEIHTLAGLDPNLARLRRYMQQKTLKLNQAFMLGRIYRPPAR